MTTKFITAVALTLAVFGSSVSFAEAGQRHSGGGGSGTVGHAVPRGSPSAGHPIYPGGGYHPPYYGGYYRPYYGYYGYYGYPYGYYPYGFGFSIGFGFGYGYGYPYGYYGYPGYAATTYGGLKIEGMPPDASVYADGYYVGIAGDFNGTFKQLNLEAGPHRVEVTREGAPPASVDVNIRPGQTVTFRAQ